MLEEAPSPEPDDWRCSGSQHIGVIIIRYIRGTTVAGACISQQQWYDLRRQNNQQLDLHHNAIRKKHGS